MKISKKKRYLIAFSVNGEDKMSIELVLSVYV